MIKVVSRKRLNRIERRLRLLYGPQAPRLVERFLMMIGRYGVGLDRGSRGRLWDEKDTVLITYADTISNSGEDAPLEALEQFCTRHLKGAIQTVHLLPFYPWSSDDGFSVIDYRKVDPANGTWDHVRRLGQSFNLAFDLVLNHCSVKSSWFRDFIAGIDPARQYFLPLNPDGDYSSVVRPRTSPLLTETRTRDGTAYVWTTFSADQVDLNWRNPEILFEFLDILMQYIASGMRIVRLDAVAFLWKELGTTCIHLPETHEVVKLLRDVVDLLAPGTLLLSETNVPHRENVSYFGNGDEAHMVYQFSLPPLLLHGLLTGDASYLTRWAQALEAPPPGCTFFNFTASHDGVGLRPLEGVLPNDETEKLVNKVQESGGLVSWRSLPDGSKQPYELNISYFSALAGSAPDSAGIRRFICSQALMLSLQGIPGMYIHSLLATPNDMEAVEETGINRRINRHKWDRSALNGHLRKKLPKKVFQTLLQMLRHRAQHTAFHPDGGQVILDLGPSCFGLVRQSPDGAERIVCLFSFSPEAQTIDKSKVQGIVHAAEVFDALGGRMLALAEAIKLLPYEALWLVVPSK